jgi:hypothetical protein
MDAVSAAKIKLSSDKLRRDQDEQRPQRTEAEMADMRKRMAEAGNGVLSEMRSRMGGQKKAP